MSELIYPELSYKIIGLAMEVHSNLGYGFLEKVYEHSLMLLFNKYNIKAEQQSQVPVYFEDQVVGHYVCDIIVEKKIILELKTVDKITDVHKAQLMNYLKATGIKLGIILNFKNKSLEQLRIVL